MLIKIKQISKQLFIFTTLAFCFFLAASSLFAQEKSKDAPCRPIAPEDTASTPPEVRALPYCFPTTPVNCEEVLFYIDAIVYKVQKNKYESIIVIGRVGKSEKSAKYNRTRLNFVKAYLSHRSLKDVKIIIATGEKAEGNAQLEFYVDGKLFNVLPFARNNVASCAGLG
ncbi:MAG: hypothetical protein H0V90_02460 [Blastocatellia bacterium]|nr:hypothetical protein [Blastocatellia bacterium]